MSDSNNHNNKDPGRQKLSLVATPDRLAVCRLPARAPIPTWANNHGGGTAPSFFCSITRTAQELSIVCPQDWVPNHNHQQQQDDGENNDDLKVEDDWIGLQVEGPLDFGLTGIMARLTAPLAQAQISIFAISTYDTDYLLVRRDKLNAAIRALEDTQQFVVTVVPNAPATSFVPDDVDMVRPLQEEPPSAWPETFGLVLVAGWPPSTAVQQDYTTRIVPLLRQCLDDDDPAAAAYVYPSTALHCTLATLWPFVPSRQRNQQPVATRHEQDELSQHATRVVQRALTRWKQQQQQQQQQVDGKAAPLSLQLHSCQLGAKAAILLWKDSSGQVRRLRSLLRQEIEDDNNISEENRTAQQLLAQGLHIPDILHTTVLRFSRTPPGDGAQIQANFQRALGGQQSPPMVQLQWDIDSITLVCERRPYMHHVDDEGDVLVREEMTNEADGT